MALDTSIYGNLKSFQAPDMMESFTKAKSLSQLGLQNQRLQNQLSEDEANAKEAARIRYTKAAIPEFEALNAMPEQERAKRFSSTMKMLEQQGMPTDRLNRDLNGDFIYDPTVWNIQYSGIQSKPEYQAYQNAKAELDSKQYQLTHMKNADDLAGKRFALDAQKAKDEKALAYAKLNAEEKKGASGINEGQKVLDREFAKDYNEWTSGGAKRAQSEINKLTNVLEGLKSGGVTTGGLTGAFHDRLTSDSVLSARADVQSTVMNSLRAILGAQFTEKEGERIIKNTWNEADSTQNNVARLERLIGDLQSQAEDKNMKARYYENVGSLAGFKPSMSQSDEVKQSAARSGGFSDPFVNSANASTVKTLKPDLKEINGKKYVKVKGGWELSE